MFLSKKDILLLADPSIIEDFKAGKIKPYIATANPVLQMTGDLHYVSTTMVEIRFSFGSDMFWFVELPLRNCNEEDMKILQDSIGGRVTITLSIDAR